MTTPDALKIIGDAIWSALDGNVTCKDKTKMARADIDVIFDMEKIAADTLENLAAEAAVTTVEQLNDLPVGCVVADDTGTWTRRTRSWYHPNGPIAGQKPKLPATLLYHPAARHR